MKSILKFIAASVLGSAITIGAFQLFYQKNVHGANFSEQSVVPAKNVVYAVNEDGKMVPLDFIGVSNKVMDAVVHIKSISTIKPQSGQYYNYDPFRDLFGDDILRQFFGSPSPNRQYRNPEPRQEVGTGSGVIINEQGYIVTNNHVINGADEIEVSLHNNEVYKAKVVGSDPSTDIALLQIKKDGLPIIPFANSDQVQVGEWTLAIGNPFNLNSTVTAGIISAKGRNINIIGDNSAIEAFLQTDAAINPGNSGGALVNLQGELIGINTAIASPTGTYTGYGFAVPSNLVSKVVEDIMKYGVVQRAYLGVMIRNVDGSFAQEKKLKTNEGAYVDSLMDKSAAAMAGIKTGDVITHVNGNKIRQSADLLETIARQRPGDKVELTVNRDGRTIDFPVVLANAQGDKKLATKENMTTADILGANFETLDKQKAEKLGIKGGVIVKNLKNGVLKQNTPIREGFIITGVNNEPVTTVEEFEKAMSNKKGGVMLSGIYEDMPGQNYYAFGLK